MAAGFGTAYRLKLHPFRPPVQLNKIQVVDNKDSFVCNYCPHPRSGGDLPRWDQHVVGPMIAMPILGTSGGLLELLSDVGAARRHVVLGHRSPTS